MRWTGRGGKEKREENLLRLHLDTKIMECCFFVFVFDSCSILFFFWPDLF